MCSFLLLYLSVSTYLPLQVFISLFSLLYLFVFIYLYLLHFIYSFLPLYSTCVSSYIFLYSFLNALGISLYAHLSLSLTGNRSSEYSIFLYVSFSSYILFCYLKLFSPTLFQFLPITINQFSSAGLVVMSLYFDATSSNPNRGNSIISHLLTAKNKHKQYDKQTKKVQSKRNFRTVPCLKLSFSTFHRDKRMQ